MISQTISKIFTIVLVFVVAGIFYQEAQPLLAEREAKAAVRELMKDPDSARFSDTIRVSHAGKSVMACGFVNGRNAFGGYAGDRLFVYWQDRVFVASDDQALAAMDCCDIMLESRRAEQAVLSHAKFWSTCGALEKSSTWPFDFGEY